MGSKIFFLINGAVILFIIARMILGRKNSRPTPLQVGDTKNPPLNPETVETSRPEPQEFSTKEGERSLNCIFIFNGHNWDAFEVLGIPAGSSRDAIMRAVVDFRRNHSKDTEFLQALSDAIDKQIPR